MASIVAEQMNNYFYFVAFINNKPETVRDTVCLKWLVKYKGSEFVGRRNGHATRVENGCAVGDLSGRPDSYDSCRCSRANPAGKL